MNKISLKKAGVIISVLAISLACRALAPSSPTLSTQVVIESSPNVVQTEKSESEISPPVETANPLSGSLSGNKNLELVGQIGGMAQTFNIKGNIAYLGVGPRLHIIDISNPSVPTLINMTEPYNGIISGFLIDDNFAFMTVVNEGLIILDISEPTSPKKVAHFLPDSLQISAMTVKEKIVYIREFENGRVLMVDVIDPINPSMIGSYKTPSRYIEDVEIRDGILFVANSLDGLRIVDITDPSNPKEINNIDVGDAINVHVSSELLFVGTWDGLSVFNITEPSNPKMISQYDDIIAASLFVIDNQAYFLIGGGDRLSIQSVNDPENLLEEGNYEIPRILFDNDFDLASMFVDGEIIYMVSQDLGFRSFKLTNNSSLSFVGSYELFGMIEAVTISDNYAYLACRQNGLKIVDISNPTRPELIGAYKTPGFASGISVSNDIAYIASGFDGIQLVSVRNPSNPELFGSIEFPNTNISDVYVSDVTAYIRTSDGVSVLDVTNPLIPKELDFINVFNYWLNGSFSNGRNTALVYDRNSDTNIFRIMDIRQLNLPLVSTSNSNFGGVDVFVDSNLAYLVGWIESDRSGYFQIWDIHSPMEPIMLSETKTPNENIDIFVRGNIALILSRGGNPVMLDISDPTSPKEIGSYNGKGCHGWNWVYPAGDYFYASCYEGGLYILK